MDLERVRTDLTTGAVTRSFDAEEAAHVEVCDDRMWGQPTIMGTRIPTFRVAELFQAGLTPAEIRDRAYPHVNLEQIEDALRYEGILRVTTTGENEVWYFSMELDATQGQLSTNA